MTYRELNIGGRAEDIVSELSCGAIDEPDFQTDAPEPNPVKMALDDLMASGLGRHLATGNAETAMCGIDRSTVSCVHPSKARKTDCPVCREAWRKLKAGKPPIVFTEQSKDTRPVEEVKAQVETTTEKFVQLIDAIQVVSRVDKTAGMSQDEIDAKVIELRKLGVSHMGIEDALGWKPQHGNRSWRICKRLGLRTTIK